MALSLFDHVVIQLDLCPWPRKFIGYRFKIVSVFLTRIIPESIRTANLILFFKLAIKMKII
ncbi:hypothetical protein HZS_3501 [Henneguya salminicola]|nr:hypothetical protein HZS_3501 [Henneguya salminicola]